MVVEFSYKYFPKGEYWTYEYKYWKINVRVVLEYSGFSICMFIILGSTSTWVHVVLAPIPLNDHTGNKI